MRHHDAIRLFGERRKQISAAKAGFHVSEGDLEPGRRQGGGQYARGVSLGQHDPWPLVLEAAFESCSTR